MLDFLYKIDVLVLQFINQGLSYPWLDQLTPIITDLHLMSFFKIFIVATMVFLFFKKYKRTGITYFLFLILSLSLNDFLGGQIKKLVERPRPFQIAELNIIQKSPGKENRSFYSNHSANMFTFATYTSAFFPAGKVVLFSLAGLIAFTRVHVGVHYPSDVLTGALIGILIGFLFSSFIKKITLKTIPQKNGLNNE